MFITDIIASVAIDKTTAFNINVVLKINDRKS